jgi:hypothetical protein
MQIVTNIISDTDQDEAIKDAIENMQIIALPAAQFEAVVVPRGHIPSRLPIIRSHSESIETIEPSEAVHDIQSIQGMSPAAKALLEWLRSHPECWTKLPKGKKPVGWKCCGPFDQWPHLVGKCVCYVRREYPAGWWDYKVCK